MSPGPAAGAGRMFALVGEMASQLADSGSLAGLKTLAPSPAVTQRILLCGMGGSAIAGDLIQPLFADITRVFAVCRDDQLPPWVDKETLVIASSYSGDTEETLLAVAAAQRRGCPLIALTSGGELLARSRRHGFPAVELPDGLPPRAALGYSLGALLWSLHRWEVIVSPQADIEAAIAVLQEGNAILAAGAAERSNPCAQLARACLGRFPVVYTTSPEAHAAGLRWKTQLNENAKSPAYCVSFPELDHNDIVGWELAPQRRQDFVLLVLRGGDEGARRAQRVAITLDLLADQFHTVHEIHCRGTRPLARIFSLVQFGDYLSCHLALAAGVDPLPVTRIDQLKQRLQKGTDSC